MLETIDTKNKITEPFIPFDPTESSEPIEAFEPAMSDSAQGPIYNADYNTFDAVCSLATDKAFHMDITANGYDRLLTEEEELELVNKIAKGDEEALKELVGHNVLFVRRMAARYQGQGVDYMDLVQEGNIGLIKAAKKFDKNQGYRFSTYAWYWIRQSMVRAIEEKGRLIRLPSYLSAIRDRIHRAQREFEVLNGKKPTIEELSKLSGLPIEKIEKALPYGYEHISLDMPVGEDKESTLGELIKDNSSNGADPSEEYMLKEKNSIIRKILQKYLTSKELYVIEQRFGLTGESPKTLRELGKQMHVSAESIRKIEGVAIRKLRYPKIRQELKVFI